MSLYTPKSECNMEGLDLTPTDYVTFKKKVKSKFIDQIKLIGAFTLGKIMYDIRDNNSHGSWQIYMDGIERDMFL